MRGSLTDIRRRIDPRGGLTVIRFPDNHLPYALTWFGMALLSCWGAWWVLRERKGQG